MTDVVFRADLEPMSCSTCNVPLKKASYVPGNHGLYCNICVEFVEEIEEEGEQEIVEDSGVVPEVNFEEAV
jgi:hypothetical protein